MDKYVEESLVNLSMDKNNDIRKDGQIPILSKSQYGQKGN